MKALKAPGEIGYPSGFFQKTWDVSQNLLDSAIQQCFSLRHILPSWNKTLICLVPKVPNAASLNLLRPIGLCNTIYKILSKISLISSLISPNQGAFIKGRTSSDNFMVAQQIIHNMKKGKGDWMTLKLDLEKAYDHIRWDFIEEFLKRYNFPSKLINLIMQCVTSVSYSIIFKRRKTESFTPKRCLRQDDPLSPNLFILAMDYLAKKFNHQALEKNWWPFKVSKGPTISHLVADDILLLAKTSLGTIHSINSTL
ncbi:hypothetical protein L6164_016595 [Bauhinia variegata]|uniref:Uncharacterized protein n=1 Tax=Bauhinia variegata TaxID=167791 RepID=A0ACB9NQ81_BAUVA|nr:hypothetical protein L6164_016595 [Bauhinia variegata]